MKTIKKHSLFILLALLIASCSNSSNDADLSPLNVANEFAMASTKGDFKHALRHLLNTKENIKAYTDFQQRYNTQTLEKKEGYKNASLQKWKEEVVQLDSIYYYTFTNSFSKTSHTIKVVKANDNWKVDFIYSENGNL